jgi:[ribosomal protein S18]-alanine N-acetyltransferase
LIAVRAGGPRDLAAIGEIQASSREASQWKPEEYLGYELLVADIDSVAAGFLVCRSVGPAEYEILNLAVLPNARRHGAGRALIAAALRGKKGAYFLEVRDSNKVAQAFYRSCGFAQTGWRPKYYTDPDEGAIVMTICS